MQEQYYLGLDLGTDSVGWAVTDARYQIKRAHQKAQWGIRLFEPASPALKRRNARVAARRLERQNQRKRLLQDMFSVEISKLDPAFFQRLKDSFFLPEDKQILQRNSLFNDPDFDDYDYHHRYPTIYHLRHELATSSEPHDVRLVYLAIAHLLDHRGHFLYQGESGFELEAKYEELFTAFSLSLEEDLGLALAPAQAEKLLQAAIDPKLKKSEKIEAVQSLFPADEGPKQRKALAKLLLGDAVNLQDLFDEEELKQLDPNKVAFGNAGFEDEKYNDLQSVLSENYFSFLEVSFSLYSYFRLKSLLGPFNSFSEAKVHAYETHKRDLLDLKYLLRKYLSKEDYHTFFNKSAGGLINYVAYSGHLASSGRKLPVHFRVDQGGLLDELKKTLSKFTVEDQQDKILVADIIQRCENRSFLPRSTTKDNSTIPNQIHKLELQRILKNAETYLPFLRETGENGYTISQMILMLCTFRVPYFVGPLNDAHRIRAGKRDGSHHAWLIKKSDQPVRPWNFDQVVDLPASADLFIHNLTNKCIYLIGEDVLPKESPSYARYSILNLINVITVNGKGITVETKQKLFQDLFLKSNNRVTLTAIVNWLRQNGYSQISKEDVDGVDLEVPGNMRAEKALEAIAPGSLSLAEKEEIVLLVTVLPDSGRILLDKLTERFADKLTAAQLKEISKLSFSGWGKFSNKFLNGIKAPDAYGELKTILQMMWESNQNLQTIMGSANRFRQAVDIANEGLLGSEKTITYRLVEEAYASPSVKKMIWQTLKIIRELVKVNGGTPKKIFIEVAREDLPNEKKKRTVSRKNQLTDLLQACKKDVRDWAALNESLRAQSEDKLRDKKLFLYYTQLGKSMYSGEPIDLNNLSAKDSNGYDYYDIDHIYPRSKTKDDSIHKNLVLVESVLNRIKADTYPIDEAIRTKMAPFWKELRARGLISEEKLKRLLRNSSLTEDELASFISRQLVETRQATKIVADILRELYPESRVVFVKAGLVSDFRYKQEEFKFPKTRGMNDLHHAKDAYLNIVVGNVFDSRFTQNPANFIRDHKDVKYTLVKMYDKETIDRQTGELAWQPGEKGTLALIRKTLRRNDILYTRQTYHQKSGQNGGLFDQMIMPKGQGQFPIKSSDPRFIGAEGIAKYGGYNKETGYGFFVARYTDKKKQLSSIIPLPLTWVKTEGKEEKDLKRYCETKLGYKDVEIIVKDLPYQSLLYYDGFPKRLLAKTGSNLKLAPALQPIFSNDLERTIHMVLKTKEKEKDEGDDTFGLPSDEEALQLYDSLISKISKPPYSLVSQFRGQMDNLVSGRKCFIELGQRDKAKALFEIIMLFQCNGILSNFSYLLPRASDGSFQGKNTQVGMISLSQNLKKGQLIQLIDQSVTGLFEKRRTLEG